MALGYPDQAHIRGALRDLHALEGDYPRALASLEAAAAGSEGDVLASLEHRLGSVHVRVGDLDLAETRFAAAEAGLSGDLVARSRLLADWAAAGGRAGKVAEAQELAVRSLADAEACGDPLSRAQANNTLGVLVRSTDPSAARDHLEATLAIIEDTSPTVRAASLNNLALASLAEGDPEGGLAFGLEALELCEQIGDRHRQAAVHNNLADLLHAMDRDEEANAHMVEAVTLFSSVGEPGELLQPQIWMLADW